MFTQCSLPGIIHWEKNFEKLCKSVNETNACRIDKELPSYSLITKNYSYN